jgi:hypothetical protein
MSLVSPTNKCTAVVRQHDAPHKAPHLAKHLAKARRRGGPGAAGPPPPPRPIWADCCGAGVPPRGVSAHGVGMAGGEGYSAERDPERFGVSAPARASGRLVDRHPPRPGGNCRPAGLVWSKVSGPTVHWHTHHACLPSALRPPGRLLVGWLTAARSAIHRTPHSVTHSSLHPFSGPPLPLPTCLWCPCMLYHGGWF